MLRHRLILPRDSAVTIESESRRGGGVTLCSLVLTDVTSALQALRQSPCRSSGAPVSVTRRAPIFVRGAAERKFRPVRFPAHSLRLRLALVHARKRIRMHDVFALKFGDYQRRRSRYPVDRCARLK